jgi:hypothetical protein
MQGGREIIYKKPAQGASSFSSLGGRQRIFVSKGFVPFGASQKRIAAQLGISDRTLRRHLDHLGIERRQIVQTKPPTKASRRLWIGGQMNGRLNQASVIKKTKRVRLWFSDVNGRTSSRQPAQAITQERFFQYRGRTWIFAVTCTSWTMPTSSMRAARII